MGKATKAEAMNRLREVTKLLLAGAEFGEIRQFAAERQWDVSDRSIRRYMEVAYKRMADASKRDSKQLLGRHLMQRRALYARCLKQGDHRSALNVLKDEASLQGIYPPTKIAPTTPDGQHPYPGPQGPVLTRRERLVRILKAEKNGDRTELRLLQQTTEYCYYKMPDTQMPQMMLQILAMQYVNEQLEQSTALLMSLWNTMAFGDPDGDWDRLGMVSAYRFAIGVEGWRLFCEGLGVDPEMLVAGNYKGNMLEVCNENICRLAPGAEELKQYLAETGNPAEEELATADDLRKGWKKMFAKVCHD